MGGHTVPAVLGTAAGLPALPLEVVPLYFELDGTFPNHEANPLEPENLRDLQAAVVEHGADLGLAFDGDADRCFVIDERGEPVSPSAVTALVATREIAKRGRRRHRRRPTSRSSTTSSRRRAVPEIIAEQRCPRRSAPGSGHSFIKAEMAREDAVFGGEHCAHYYFRDFWFADTGMLAAMHVLAALGEQARAAEPARRGIRAGMPRPARSTPRVTDAPARDRDACASGRPSRGAEFDELDGLTATHAAERTTRCGGSTCAPPTPSRCCGSTSRPPTRTR